LLIVTQDQQSFPATSFDCSILYLDSRLSRIPRGSLTFKLFPIMKKRLWPGRLLTAVLLLIAQFAFSQLVDPSATAETRALHANLMRVAEHGFLFGHQDTDAYGVTWKAEDNRSDVKDITGDFPAVHGWDLGKIGRPMNIDSVDFGRMLEWIKAAYRRGAVNTISWHLDNPLTGESTWSKGDAAKESLPGGKAHTKYLEHLNHLADFLDKCETDGVKIPIIFRPLHEHNGDWFWWGKGVASEADFINLWKFTVQFLRDERKIHHLLYAFSPDRSRLDIKNFRISYLYAYPGDEWVDVLGYDDYQDVNADKNQKQRANDLVSGLKQLSVLAKEKNKVAALTETGQEKIPEATFFTNFLLKSIKADRAINVSYVMFWRNARKNHHYVPYKGHPAADDFRKFHSDPGTLFESDIMNMYVPGKSLVKK
jgi:mannan endo-1,4-beta-mannosidase